MTGLRGLAFLIAVCLPAAACTAPAEDEGCEEMRQQLSGRHSRIEQWGNSAPIVGPWPEKQEKTVLQHKPYKADAGPGGNSFHYCIPRAQSVLLTANATRTGVGSNFVFRWLFNVGGGGGSQRILIDALNIQQVSIAAENIDVSILAEKFDPSQPYVGPDDVVVTAGASFADGNVSSSRATYTQGFTAPNGLNVFAVPFMANSFLIEGGDGQADSPFLAGLTYQVGRAVYKGASLLPALYSSTFLELPGNADILFINNANVATAVGDIQWGLDL